MKMETETGVKKASISQETPGTHRSWMEEARKDTLLEALEAAGTC